MASLSSCFSVNIGPNEIIQDDLESLILRDLIYAKKWAKKLSGETFPTIQYYKHQQIYSDKSIMCYNVIP